jgi:hypothetical protein
MAADINTNTVDGLLAFCEYLIDRGYAAPSQVRPWMIATRNVFSKVEGSEEIGAVSLAEFDLEEYLRRFEIKARGQYKHESLASYARRVTNAIAAYHHFLEHGKPPEFRKRAAGGEGAAKSAAPAKVKSATPLQAVAKPGAGEVAQSGAGMLHHQFPLRSGEVARLHLPQNLEKQDAERLILFLRALSFEPQGQIAERASAA